MHRDQLPIAEPCHADWDAMTGDDRKRFCDDCTTNVHDLSAMTERQASALLEETPSLCVRYSCGSDGQILYKSTKWSRVVAVAAALFAATPALAAPAPAEHTGPTWVDRVVEVVKEIVAPPEEVVSMGEVEVLMGDVAIEPEPEPEPEIVPRPLMGRIAMPRPEPSKTMGKVVQPHSKLPPLADPLPEPQPGESVIPEVQAVLDKQAR